MPSAKNELIEAIAGNGGKYILVDVAGAPGDAGTLIFTGTAGKSVRARLKAANTSGSPVTVYIQWGEVAGSKEVPVDLPAKGYGFVAITGWDTLFGALSIRVRASVQNVVLIKPDVNERTPAS